MRSDQVILFNEHIENKLLYRTPVVGRKEMFYLTTHSTHFIYGYMASDIWYTTTQIAREETAAVT